MEPHAAQHGSDACRLVLVLVLVLVLQLLRAAVVSCHASASFVKDADT